VRRGEAAAPARIRSGKVPGESIAAPHAAPIGFPCAGRAAIFASEDNRAMILKVARLGHPIVRVAARQLTVDEIKSHDFQLLIDNMVETMHEYSGVGLAATQVHLPIQLTVLEVERNPRYPDAPSVPLTVLINPVVTILDKELIDAYEGCLSIPDMRGVVPRFKRLRVQALDRNAEPLDIVAEDFHARVIQHETDHLKGEVYLDRMPNMRTLAHLAEFQRYVLEGGAGASRK
jgi:peptide deformylase